MVEYIVLPGIGESIAVDRDSAGVSHIIAKLQSGIDGSTEDTSAFNPLPVRNDNVEALLRELLVEAKLTNKYLSELINEEFEVNDLPDGDL